MSINTVYCLIVWALILFIGGCSSGDLVQRTSGTDQTENCDGFCADTPTNLNVSDVEKILSQGIQEAINLGEQATIAVVDRTGNVLAVYRMGEAESRHVLISSLSSNPVNAGLEGIRLPLSSGATLNLDHQAAISKAVTAAYLSSEGNAFSTRTANQIVQEHFNPGEDFQPAGPLFGVQFSQLSCSDFTLSNTGVATSPGPHRSPLGLSADPGGFPLYKAGTVVGGVGVVSDGVYGIDSDISDLDRDNDELIAYAATFGFSAPATRRADSITVEGKVLRFSDINFDDLLSDPAAAGDFSALPAGVGQLIPVEGYVEAAIRSGTAFGLSESGIVLSDEFSQYDAFEFVDASGDSRFPPVSGSSDSTLAGVSPLSESEVKTILNSALEIASKARAQIRKPLNSTARVTISVVDTQGEILGMIRSRDAPVFGADVSLQKARTASFFSSSKASAFLNSLPSAVYLNDGVVGQRVDLGQYVSDTQEFLGDSSALTNGAVAFSDRAGGNLSRPFFPDGINGNESGPLSKKSGEWSVFSTGLQLDLSINGILQHVLYVASDGALQDVDVGCAGISLSDNLTGNQEVSSRLLANGLQIFPGSVPIYRGGVLVGGIGVSGDGVDQDDMIAFLGVHNAGVALGGTIGNAPPGIRADNLAPRGTRLRYIQCPQSPFLNSTADNVCKGK